MAARPEFLLTVPIRDPTTDTITILWNSIRSDVHYLSSKDAFPPEAIASLAEPVQNIEAFFASLPDYASPGVPRLYREVLIVQWPQLLDYTSRHTFQAALSRYATFFGDHVKNLRLFSEKDIPRADIDNFQALHFQITHTVNDPTGNIALHLGPLDFCAGLVTRAVTYHAQNPIQRQPIPVNFDAAARELRTLKSLIETMRRFVNMRLNVERFAAPLAKFLAESLERLLVEAEVAA
jgi:hypothetical protein